MRHTEQVQVDPVTPAAAPLHRAASVLRSGGLVAFPTETVYGLGASVDDPTALRAVFEAKGRPATDPLIVHVPDVDALDQVAVPDARVVELARHFWPGPLTLVLPRRPRVPDEVTAGGGSVGVRVPSHPVAHALLVAARVPIAAPSANRFGRISPTSASHVLDELEGRVDLVLDGGPCTLGIESTVLELTAAVPTVLRPGGVTLEQLQDVLGRVDQPEHETVPEDRASTAPGRFLRHYAPSTPLVLVQAAAEVAVELAGAMRDVGLPTEVVELPAGAEDAARVLYERLRRADAGAATVLLASTLDPAGLGRAVNDRLYRAAHGRVVTDAGPGTVERLAALLS